MTRIVRAYHILNDEGVPIGVFYPHDGVFPFPSKKTPEKGVQSFQKLQRIDNVRHPPNRDEVLKKYKGVESNGFI